MKLYECFICKKKSTEEEDFEICIKCDEIVCLNCLDDNWENFINPICKKCIEKI